MSRVHLVNPSTKSFGVAVITPRWLYVLASATGTRWGDPQIVDETLDPLDVDTIASGDVVGIGIHTGNARRGYEIGRKVRQRGAWVVYGGIHATLFPDEAVEHGMAHAVVRGDGDVVWQRVIEDCLAGEPRPVYEGGRIAGDQFASARWDLLPSGRYMWASVQTVRGCPKHCSFCSVWRTDGQEPRQRAVDRVIREVVELRRLGFRFIALADDNFYPVTMSDLAQARRRADGARLRELEALRAERFALMARLAELPDDLVFYTQITMEAAEDPTFLEAMRRAKIRGALVGVESVSVDGLKDVYKGFNLAGEELVARLRAFRRYDIHVLGSFIFGLPSDTKDSFDATVALAHRADLTFAQFVLQAATLASGAPLHLGIVGAGQLLGAPEGHEERPAGVEGRHERGQDGDPVDRAGRPSPSPGSAAACEADLSASRISSLLKKPAKREDARQRQPADGEGPAGVGQPVPQAAEPPHVDHVAHRVHHAAGGEEQQGLEERVREQVEHRRPRRRAAPRRRRPAPSAMNM